MVRSRKFSFGLLLLEIFLVLLGVLLALGLNDWNTNRGHRARAAEALDAIREEIIANRAEVEQSFTYHGALMDTLPRLTEPPGFALFAQGYTRPANLLDTAWELAHATDALHHVAPEMARAASRAYAEQRRYQENARAIGTPLFALLLNEGASGVLQRYRSLMSVIGALRYREQQLLAQYDETLAALEKRDSLGK